MVSAQRVLGSYAKMLVSIRGNVPATFMKMRLRDLQLYSTKITSLKANFGVKLHRMFRGSGTSPAIEAFGIDAACRSEGSEHEPMHELAKDLGEPWRAKRV